MNPLLFLLEAVPNPEPLMSTWVTGVGLTAIGSILSGVLWHVFHKIIPHLIDGAADRQKEARECYMKSLDQSRADFLREIAQQRTDFKEMLSEERQAYRTAIERLSPGPQR